jgi:endonuclease/exonuclease/phosphatase family metal-dependent hydrolase
LTAVGCATYNIKHCDVGGTIDVKRVGGIIKALGCPLVALQEVHYKSSSSGYVDQPRELARYSGHPYYAFGPGANGQSGCAILSYFPIISKRTLRIPNVPGTSYNQDRCVLCVDLALPPDGKQFQFCSTHWGFEHAQMVAMGVCSTLWHPGRPNTLLAGDFNNFPGSIPYQCMALWYHPPATTVIDNMFATGGVRVLAHAFIPDGTPDHTPLIAHVEVN